MFPSRRILAALAAAAAALAASAPPALAESAECFAKDVTDEAVLSGAASSAEGITSCAAAKAAELCTSEAMEFTYLCPEACGTPLPCEDRAKDYSVVNCDNRLFYGCDPHDNVLCSTQCKDGVAVPLPPPAEKSKKKKGKKKMRKRAAKKCPKKHNKKGCLKLKGLCKWRKKACVPSKKYSKKRYTHL